MPTDEELRRFREGLERMGVVLDETGPTLRELKSKLESLVKAASGPEGERLGKALARLDKLTTSPRADMTPKFKIGERVRYTIPTVAGVWPQEGKLIEVRTVESGETFYYIRQSNGIVQHGVREGWITPVPPEPEPAAPKWATSQTADLAERDADEVLCLYFRDGQFYGAASRDIDSCSAIITHQGPVPAVAVAARRIVQFAIQDDDED